MPQVRHLSWSRMLVDAQSLMGAADATHSGDLTRNGVAGGNVEDPGYRGGVWGISLSREPPAYGTASERERGVCECWCIGRVQHRRELVEEVIVVSEQVSGSIRQRDDVSFSDRLEQWQQFVAHPISPKSCVGVGRVGDRFEAEVRAQRVGLGSSEREDRVGGAGSNGREAGRSGTTEEREQGGFGLIVRGVAEHRGGPEQSVARLAGARLEVRAIGELRMRDPPRNAELCGDHFARSRGIVRRRVEPMVDVHGHDIQTGRHSECQECRGVRTAGTRADHRLRRARKGAASQELADQRIVADNQEPLRDPGGGAACRRGTSSTPH